MALDDLADPGRLTIERWVGPIDDDEIAKYDAYVTALGEPILAALQELTTRRAVMVSSPTTVESGTDRVEHYRNLAAIDKLIDELVAAINDLLDDLSITNAGLDLLESAGTGSTEETIGVRVYAANPRRG